MKRKLLLAGRDRALAVTVIGLMLAQHALASPIYKVLHAFGSGEDGAGVWDSLVFDSKGSLYGTTSGGGTYGGGTVFKLTYMGSGHWAETVLHSFGKSDFGGCVPFGGPILDAVGNVYGTTQLCGLYHAGVAFELKPQGGSWTEVVLHNFCSQSGCKDGSGPWAGLTWGSLGHLYGTAFNVFELTHSDSGWVAKALYTFCSKSNCQDGAAPYAGVIIDASGNVYGTTKGGGIGCPGEGCGVVYEIRHTATGWTEKVLHYFDNNGKDGYTPALGALIMDGFGSLYGATAGGGCCGGVVFKLTPGFDGQWKETILYNFKGGASGFEAGGGVVMG